MYAHKICFRINVMPYKIKQRKHFKKREEKEKKILQIRALQI